jgi:hypothetical protein
VVVRGEGSDVVMVWTGMVTADGCSVCFFYFTGRELGVGVLFHFFFLLFCAFEFSAAWSARRLRSAF